MKFALTEEQAELTAAARNYLDRTYPATRIAELADGPGHDIDAWPELVRQGWLDADLGMVECALLAEEGGRALHPVPWWATTVALPAYRAAGVEPPPGPVTWGDGASGGRATARPGGEWRLHGAVPAVVQAEVAVTVVVAAQTPDGLALFAVRRDAPGVSLVTPTAIDPLRTTSRVTLADAPARCLVDPPAAPGLLAAIDARATTLLACEAVGVADRALEFAVAHAQSRVQFDRPIGSFQAVSQSLADSYAELELARSLGYRAACVLQDATENPADAVACAAYAGARVGVRVCEAAIQVCGGMGVTWEFPLHWWFRRALWLEAAITERSAPLDILAAALFGER
jgi:alkylation response protein AidB-like acyl-CoA dehydrogenase